MIPHVVPQRVIERVGGAETAKVVKLRAPMTGKGMRILSKGLYGDVIRAVVREICTNAADAQIEAGRPDVPFEVRLPSSINPNFSVRDYGLGISPEDIEGIYTVFFESTKTKSNDFNGTLGLGSKAPYAYVDAYTVISRHQGMRRTYTAFWDEHDEPTFLLLNEAPTNEASGLEVIVPVNSNSDRSVFVDRASYLLSTFDVRPKIIGVGGFTFRDPEVQLQGDGWKLLKGDGTATALMGWVQYPISADSILGIRDDPREPDIRGLASANVQIEFPNGSLVFLPSREALNYDRATSPALMDRMATVLREMDEQVSQAFAACQTEYEARLLFRKISGKGAFATLRPNYKAEWRGRPITSESFTIDFHALPEGTLVETWEKSTRRFGHVTRRIRFIHSSSDCLIPVSENMVVFINDLRKGGNSRIRDFRKANPKVPVSAVSLPRPDDRIALLKMLDGVPIRNVSELPEPIRPPRAPRAKTVPTEKYISMGGIYRLQTKPGGGVANPGYRASWRQISDQEIPTGGAYIIILSMSPFQCGMGVLQPTLETAIQNGIIDGTIYGIHQRSLKKFLRESKKGAWTLVGDVIRETVRKKIVSREFIKSRQARVFRDIYINQSGSFWSKRALLMDVSKRLPRGHFIKTLLATEPENDAAIYSDGLRYLAGLLNIDVPEPPLVGAASEWELLPRRYPLMKALLSTNEIFNAKEVADYVKMVDSKLEVDALAA